MDPSLGETDLTILLANLEPVLSGQQYVFHPGEAYSKVLYRCRPWATICEDEGTTYILSTDQADSLGITYQDMWARITLRVHSSLHAVGLTAAVSSILATNGISANMVAGYFHDHLFVPIEQAMQALALLMEMGKHASTKGKGADRG